MEIFRTRRQYPAAPPIWNRNGLRAVFCGAFGLWRVRDRFVLVCDLRVGLACDFCGLAGFLCGKWYVCMNEWPVENSNKNHKNIVQKVVDVSIFWEYYRDSS